MSKLCTVLLLAVSCILVATPSQADEMEMAQPVVLANDAVVWGEAPPTLPPGAKLAVVAGDPGVVGGTYTMRVWVPAGYVVPPHWHPVRENVTVLSGSIVVGMGDVIDREKTQTLGPGAFLSMPAEHHHYALFDEESTIQLHGIGPFGINYVNPEDDPTRGTNED